MMDSTELAIPSMGFLQYPSNFGDSILDTYALIMNG
jgi:hypothetical protein